MGQMGKWAGLVFALPRSHFFREGGWDGANGLMGYFVKRLPFHL